MRSEIAGFSIPATRREQGFVLVGFLLGIASGLVGWLIEAVILAG